MRTNQGDGAAERGEAERQRTLGLQVVWNEYGIEEKIVRPVFGSGIRRYYYPITTPSVVNDFARLRSGNQDACLRFVQRWGLAGYMAKMHGDPIDWLKAHATGVDAVLRIHRAFRESDEDAEAQIIEKMRGESVGLGDTVLPLSVSTFGSAPSARLLVAQVVEPHLKEFHYTLRDAWPGRWADSGKRFRLEFEWHRLLSAIYRHLAEVLIEASVRVCESCGLPFVATHGRQRFCPAPPGDRSLCEQRSTKAQRRRKGKRS